MSGELPLDQRVRAIIFDMWRAYNDYSLSMINNPEELKEQELASIPYMGTRAQFFNSVDYFAKRYTWPDCSQDIIDNYTADIAAIDTEDEPPVTTIFIQVSADELLLHGVSLDQDLPISEVRQSYVPDEDDRAWMLNEEKHNNIAKLYTQDRELFWRLALTRALPYYEKYTLDKGTTPSRLHRRSANRLCEAIEDAIDTGYTPFTPSEFQVFIDGFIVSQIRKKDELNPFTYRRLPRDRIADESPKSE